MAMETELKYSVSTEAWDALLVAEQLGEYALDEAERRVVRDEYADTRDRAISGAGYVFRIRSGGGKRLACLKSLDRGNGLGHSREEYECDIGSFDSPHDWPRGDTRDRFLEITRGEPVLMEVEIRQTRIIRRLRSEGESIAEMSLDEVCFKTGSGDHVFLELEVELLSEEAPDALENVHSELSMAYDVHLVDQSKYERAIAFRDGLSRQ